MTSPCRSCYLGLADKNNATCLRCVRRVAYVNRLAEELCFSSSRSAEEAAAPRVSLLSRQAQFLAVAPETLYE
ncbi:MAG: hypothetical protein WHT06_04020 [Desulfobacterales bacterium]